jgi:hypothetical protein
MHEYAHHPQPKVRQCPQCLKYMQCKRDKEREHLDDGHRNVTEHPEMILQNTQIIMKTHKSKLKTKAHKTHKSNKNMIQKSWKQTT